MRKNDHPPAAEVIRYWLWVIRDNQANPITGNKKETEGLAVSF
jgi:hypothetical protein